MIVFVLDYSCYQTVKNFCFHYKIFIAIFNCDFFISINNIQAGIQMSGTPLQAPSARNMAPVDTDLAPPMGIENKRVSGKVFRNQLTRRTCWRCSDSILKRHLPDPQRAAPRLGCKLRWWWPAIAHASLVLARRSACRHCSPAAIMHQAATAWRRPANCWVCPMKTSWSTYKAMSRSSTPPWLQRLQTC